MPTELHQHEVILESTTETQAELDHATGPAWREHFDPEQAAAAAEPKPGEAAAAKKPAAATKIEPASEAGKEGAKKGESETETDDLPAGARKRIDRLTARLRDTETQLAEMRKGAPKAEPAKATNTDPEPQKDDPKFKSWEEWNAAHTRWAVRDEQRRLDAQNEEREQAANTKEIYDSHVARSKSYAEEHPDYEDKVRDMGSFEFSSRNANLAFQVAIVESENGPEMLEYLADHPEEMEKFKTLSPVKVQLALGRISAALSPSTSEAQTAPAAEIKSKAPTPTTPVRRSSAAPATRLDDPKISTDEYIRIRQSQQQSKRRH